MPFNLNSYPLLFDLSEVRNLPTIHHVAIDSREVVPGSLFFALPGAKTDGHAFIEEAFNNGCIAAVVTKKNSPITGHPLIHVENTLRTLQELAKAYIARLNARIIAVTGSIGKTTVKEMLKTLLIPFFPLFATPSNQNSQAGLPLSLLNGIQGNEEILILEMGMSGPLEIARLVEVVPPDISIITQIALVHAAFFENLEAIARAKREILLSPKTKTALLPADDPLLPILSENFKGEVITNGFSNKADYKIQQEENGTWSLRAFKKLLGPFLPLPVLGEHNLYNFILAVAGGVALGIPIEELLKGASRIELPPNRLQRISYNQIHFIDDSYNASEISMCAALKCMPAPKKGGRRCAVLGDMRELGRFDQKAHHNVGLYALNYLDQLFCIGESAKEICKAWEEAGRNPFWCATINELKFLLKEHLHSEDVVLIKGSNSLKLWKIVEEWE